MGLAVTVDEELLAGVIESSDRGTGVQRVMAKEGGFARYQDHTITGNTDRLAVDYGKIFEAQGKRMEFHAARLTHMPADMISADNENMPGGASERPDLDLLRQFSPEYLLALEGVGEALELLYNGELTPEAAESLNTLLSQLAQLPPLMELAASGQLTPEMTERLEQVIESVLESLDSLKQSVPNMPQALYDFALDVVAEAASVAPIKPALRAAITRTETAMGRATPPVQRMTLSALMMGGRGGTSPLAILARPHIKPANNNAPMAAMAAPLARINGQASAADTKASGPQQTAGSTAKPATPAQASESGAESTASTPTQAQAEPAPAPTETSTAQDSNAVDIPAQDNPTTEQAQADQPQTDSIEPITENQTEMVAPIAEPPAPAPQPEAEIVSPTAEPPASPPQDPPPPPQPEEMKNPESPINDPQPQGGGKPETAKNPDNNPSNPTSQPHICKCKDPFNQMAKGEIPDTRNEADFVKQYGEELVSQMGVDGLKQMEADNNALTDKMNQLAEERGMTAAQKQEFSNNWDAIIRAGNGGNSSRSQNFEHICNDGCNHANTQTVGETAQSVTREVQNERKLVL